MIYLHGVGHFHPENVITNEFLESLDIGTTVDWILERVGIEERRTILPLDYIRETKNARPWETDGVRLYTNAQMAAAATRMAVGRAGIKPEDIGMVISGSSLNAAVYSGHEYRMPDAQHGLCGSAVGGSLRRLRFGDHCIAEGAFQ